MSIVTEARAGSNGETPQENAPVATATTAQRIYADWRAFEDGRRVLVDLARTDDIWGATSHPQAVLRIVERMDEPALRRLVSVQRHSLWPPLEALLRSVHATSHTSDPDAGGYIRGLGILVRELERGGLRYGEEADS